MLHDDTSNVQSCVLCSVQHFRHQGWPRHAFRAHVRIKADTQRACTEYTRKHHMSSCASSFVHKYVCILLTYTLCNQKRGTHTKRLRMGDILLIYWHVPKKGGCYFWLQHTARGHVLQQAAQQQTTTFKKNPILGSFAIEGY